MSENPINPRPLLVRFGALGDMVLLTVMIRGLHERYGQPVDIVGSGSWTRPLLRNEPGVGNVYTIGSRKRPYWLSAEKRALARRLRERGAGPTWLCDADSDSTETLLRHAGVPASLVLKAREACPLRRQEHTADRWIRFANMSPPGAPAPPCSISPWGQLHVDDVSRADCLAWLHSRSIELPLLLIQPGNKRTMRRGARDRASNTKYWPEESWAAVLQGLHERHPAHTLVLLGVPQEAGMNDEILELAKVGNSYNAARELPVGRLLALGSLADGMVSVDSGPAHAAAAVGCNVVALFGKADPFEYEPRGPGTRSACLTGTFEGEVSMLGIQPAQVLEACDRVFDIAR